MKNKVFLFGTFGNLKGLPKGGGQTSARRIWRNLERLGYSVSITNRHRDSCNNPVFHKIKTVLGMMHDILSWSFKLLLKKRSNSLTIVIGYGGIMSLFDSIIVRISSNLGYKTVYYLKGGGTERLYINGISGSQASFKKCLLNSDLVLTEGEPNVDFVNRITKGKIRVHCVPNFIEDGFMPNQCPERNIETINLFYFGRIEEEKNVKLIVETFNILCNKIDNLHLTIVGRLDTQYAIELQDMIDGSPYAEKITRIGHSTHAELAKMLRNQHFFVFPSQENREGHSNALNEAMSWGLVPIVSDNNFLPSIVGNNNLVVSTMSAESYAQAIADIIDNNKICYYSKMMYERVKTRYTQAIVCNILKETLFGLN